MAFRATSPFLMLYRSVHNTRIERLWYDVTEGFGRKWKDFFYILEGHHNLNISDPSHIWLLHRLFLPAINAEALAWAEAWNSHKIQLDGERRSSPRQLYIRSSITDGIRGLPPLDSSGDSEGDINPEDGGEPEGFTSYGIDWEALEDPHLMAHYHENNPQDEAANTSHSRPEWINEVVCEPPNCPLNDEQVERLEQELVAIVDIGSKDMDTRRVTWVTALQMCMQIVSDGEDEAAGA